MEDYLTYLQKRRIDYLKREESMQKFMDIFFGTLMVLGAIYLIVLAVIHVSKTV
jgi:threonine/homoserine/homoserine lactone efflux protein